MEDKNKKELEERKIVFDDFNNKDSNIEFSSFIENNNEEIPNIDLPSFSAFYDNTNNLDSEINLESLDSLNTNSTSNDNPTNYSNINYINESDYTYQDNINNNYDYNNKKTEEQSSNISDKFGFIKDKLDNMYLGYKTRLGINIAGIILFSSLFIVFLISSISINKKSTILYKQNSALDYKVYLKKNDYYNNEYLDKNMQYIASIIDNIRVNFNYNFNINEKINYKYTYYIKSQVKVSDSDDDSKVIYQKVDRLTEPVVLSLDNSNGFNINEDVVIDYNKYNEQIKAFKSSYLINAKSNLILSLCVGVEDEKNNTIMDINSNEVMKLTIPLTEQMINIKMDYKETNNTNNIKVYKNFNISNKILFALSILCLMGSILYIILLIMFLNKTTKKKSIYDITLSKILREYDRVIVNSKKIIELSGQMIDLDSFNELLDVRDNLEKPIIFKEIHKGQKSIFVVKNNDENYRYILKLADLQKENIK